jgi:3-oxoadipate enol-lactonase
LRTVVLSGSLGSTSAMWDEQAPALEDAGFRVVRTDHPGHGGRPLVDVNDVRDLARDALAQVDADWFSFVGLSIGGAIGLQLAFDEPERIERLVLACTSARFGEPDGWIERAMTVRVQGVEAVAPTVIGRWFTDAFADASPFFEMLVSTDAEGYARCCDALALWDARPDLARVTMPTLVIAAAEDPSTPPDQGRAIADGVPGARFELIADAAHLAPVERPGEFNRLVLDFLA